MLLSIVGVDRNPHGYYAGKLAQERALGGSGAPATIVRATQFHEFAGQIAERARIGPLPLAPRARVQPIAAAEVGIQTDYVLLDEPLNNLDMKHAVRMMKHLHRAATELGKTVVIVLHDINFAARYADYICCVKRGEVVRFGTAPEVMTSEVLTGVFDTPVDILATPSGPLAVYY